MFGAMLQALDFIAGDIFAWEMEVSHIEGFQTAQKLERKLVKAMRHQGITGSNFGPVWS